MHRFLIVVEKAEGNYSAYSPDLPGCIATGATKEEAEQNMYEAMKMHVEGLIEDGLPVPASDLRRPLLVLVGRIVSRQRVCFCHSRGGGYPCPGLSLCRPTGVL